MFHIYFAQTAWKYFDAELLEPSFPQGPVTWGHTWDCSLVASYKALLVLDFEVARAEFSG